MIKKIKGLTLMETLLVLLVAAIITTVAVRYFSVSQRSLAVTQAITQIQTLTKASYEWLEAQKQENFGSNGAAISLQALINAGLVENTEAASKDPWGKTITIAPGSDPNRVKITMPNIPKLACKNLARRLENVSKISMPACNGSPSTYTGEF